MTIDALPQMLAPQALADMSARTTQPAAVNFSLADVARFEAAMNPQPPTAGVPIGSTGAITPTATAGPSSMANSEVLRAFFDPLNRINGAPERFMATSEKLAANPDVGAGDMLMTMVGVQKFVFECQLTSSVANRTSDGIQELFRQQS